MIIHVALRKYNDPAGLIISCSAPYRHYHLCKILNESGEDSEDWEQGFLTDSMKFVNRQEAADIALECGQINELKAPPELYSEDLW